MRSLPGTTVFTVLFVSSVFATMVLLGACGNGTRPTPEQQQRLASAAGTAATLGWLAIDKPDKPLVASVKVVVDRVRDNLVAYQGAGFIGALPGIQEATAKLFPNETDRVKRVAADKLAEALLTELDRLFAKHPDWQNKGSEAAAIVGVFLDGAASSLDAFLR